MNLRNIFTYSPEECFDLGDAGEHEITFVATVDMNYEHGTRASCTIHSAIVRVDYGGLIQDLNVLPYLQTLPATLRAYEDEIIEAYMRSFERTADDYYDDFVSRAEF